MDRSCSGSIENAIRVWSLNSFDFKASASGEGRLLIVESSDAVEQWIGQGLYRRSLLLKTVGAEVHTFEFGRVPGRLNNSDEPFAMV